MTTKSLPRVVVAGDAGGGPSARSYVYFNLIDSWMVYDAAVLRALAELQSAELESADHRWGGGARDGEFECEEGASGGSDDGCELRLIGAGDHG